MFSVFQHQGPPAVSKMQVAGVLTAMSALALLFSTTFSSSTTRHEIRDGSSSLSTNSQPLQASLFQTSIGPYTTELDGEPDVISANFRPHLLKKVTDQSTDVVFTVLNRTTDSLGLDDITDSSARYNISSNHTTYEQDSVARTINSLEQIFPSLSRQINPIDPVIGGKPHSTQPSPRVLKESDCYMDYLPSSLPSNTVCDGGVWSCAGRCGQFRFPCSCHPLCSVYSTCCLDYSDVCSTEAQTAMVPIPQLIAKVNTDSRNNTDENTLQKGKDELGQLCWPCFGPTRTQLSKRHCTADE